MEGLSIDLRTIYQSIASIEAANRRMDTITSSDLVQTKAAILKAINQLRVYQFLKDHPDFQDLKVIDFLRSVNESKRQPLAYVDSDIRMLELPAKARNIISASKSGSRKATVSVNVLGGGTLSGLTDDFGPQNILNPNLKNFWADVMSTQAPVRQNYQASWGMYEAHGVVAEATINFSHVDRVNNLKILPFSEFPYNIIDICYKETSDSATWNTLPSFSINYATEDWVEYDFTFIPIHQLKIVIEQPNYIRRVSSIPESIMRKNQLWSLLQKSAITRTLHELDLTTSQTGKIAVEPEQLRYLMAIDNLDSQLANATFIGERHTEFQDYARYLEVVSKVVDQISPGVGNEVREVMQGAGSDTPDPVHTMISYDYLFGIRTVQLSSVTYNTHAYYESPEFITNGTILEAQLETEETHPSFTENDGVATYRRTSIEYEIETSPNTRFPIVPLNEINALTPIVKDELVNLSNGVGKLRFAAEGNSVTVRRNGKRVSMLDVTVSGRDIYVTNADKSATYTATYAVSDSATKVRFDEELDSVRLLKPEEFSGTDTDNKIVLKYYPYIIYEIVRDTTRWTKNENESKWSWSPDFYPVASGTVSLTNGSTTVVLTKNDVTDSGFTTLSFLDSSHLKIWIQETGETLDLAHNPPVAPTDTICYLSEPYTGDTISATRFIAGRTVTYDNQVFGLNVDTYEPIQVYVDNVKAINKTNYFSHEHPALSSSSPGETQYEYIQAGKVLYFNGPVKGNITVTYSWLTQYLKLVATLRCNVPVATFFTPKVDSISIRVKTTEL